MADDPVLLLIQRALKVVDEAHALMEQTDALLGNTARLLELRVRIMREIAQSVTTSRGAAQTSPPRRSGFS